MLADKDLVSIQEVRTKVEKAYAASQKYRHYNQEQVDGIVEHIGSDGARQGQFLRFPRRVRSFMPTADLGCRGTWNHILMEHGTNAES